LSTGRTSYITLTSRCVNEILSSVNMLTVESLGIYNSGVVGKARAGPPISCIVHYETSLSPR
jgi:hypothetical protein